MNRRTYTICTIGGDGVGPELLGHAVELLQASGVSFTRVEAQAGFDCFQKHGTALPPETEQAVKNADATLFIAVTTPPHITGYKSPIVALRQQLDLYANIRPMKRLSYASDVPHIDLVIVRENTEGLYSGKERIAGGRAVAERIITKKASERIARFAFDLARKQKRRKVTAVHKANILRLTDGLFLRMVERVASEYPDIGYDDMLVDAAAMKLIKTPKDFDVIVTTNMFGDILSDEASMLVGGPGVVPSANIGDTCALFEPMHGSVPKYRDRDVANPLATFLATAMMVDYLGELSLAANIRQAVTKSVREGVTTRDLGGNASTYEVTRSVIEYLLRGNL